MSHLVSMKVEITNKAALKTACERVSAIYNEHDIVKFYDGKTKEGTSVRLQGWRHPVVFDMKGECYYDNYNGSWGAQEELNKLNQHYTGAVVEQVAAEQGMYCTSSTNQKGELVYELVSMVG